MPDQSLQQRVLHGVDLTDAPRAIAPPATLEDPAVRALVEREAASAHAAGVREGIVQGHAEAEAAAAALAESITRALRAAAAMSATLQDDLATKVGRLAVDIASTIVLGLDEEHTGIVHRVEQAIRTVDDRPLTVVVHPDDQPLVAPVCPPGVEVETAYDLQRGEARVHGRWADADLTWDAIWTSVREVLDVA